MFFLFFPSVMTHRCVSTLAWKHFIFISPISFLICKRSLDATCVTRIWKLGASWEIPFFCYSSFQPVRKNTLLVFSTISPDFHNVSMMKESWMQVKQPWYLKSPDTITYTLNPISCFRHHRLTIVIELHRWAGRCFKLVNIKARSETVAHCHNKDWRPEGLRVWLIVQRHKSNRITTLGYTRILIILSRFI